MADVDVGSGPPLVLIPGTQGRWEYLTPAIDALAQSFRVLSFSLCGERNTAAFDPALGLDNYARQVGAILDRAAIPDAIVCGISFGGLAAIRFAAAYPRRTRALVIVSAPGPNWQPVPRHRLYMRAPWLFGPLFLLETPVRLQAELRASFPNVANGCRFVLWQLRTLLRAPLSPARMAQRAALIPTAPLVDDCGKIKAPTLIVVGERQLDRVVPVDATTRFVSLLEKTRCETLQETGHLGSITHPDRFAALVRDFSSSIGAKVAGLPLEVREPARTRSGHALA